MLNLTETAIEAIKGFIKSSDKPSSGLRIEVSGGGCSGFQYGLRLEDQPTAEDSIVDCSGIQVFVDPGSAAMLAGVTVDFVNGLEGAGFKFLNPNAKASCGCGNSFSC